jgi:hypothetical protein
MKLTDRQTQWLIRHFKHTKNDEITARLHISASYLHRLARQLGLKKTKQFMRKTQANAVVHAQAAIAAEDEEAKERRRQQANQNRNPDRCFKPGIYFLASKTAEERAAIQAKQTATWKATRRADETRLNWGLPQQTKFHFARDPDPEKNKAIIKLRCYLRNRCRYEIPGKSGMVIYITAETNRSLKLEQRAQKLGMIVREKK